MAKKRRGVSENATSLQDGMPTSPPAKKQSKSGKDEIIKDIRSFFSNKVASGGKVAPKRKRDVAGINPASEEKDEINTHKLSESQSSSLHHTKHSKDTSADDKDTPHTASTVRRSRRKLILAHTSSDEESEGPTPITSEDAVSENLGSHGDDPNTDDPIPKKKKKNPIEKRLAFEGPSNEDCGDSNLTKNKSTHEVSTYNDQIKELDNHGNSEVEVKSVVENPVETKQSKYNKLAYIEYLARKSAVPKALGTKKIPEGSETCFKDLVFVFTGDLSSLTREDATTLVKSHGGRVTTVPSSKTSYLIVGSSPSELKLKKARSLKIEIIDEDKLLNLISVKTQDEILSCMEVKPDVNALQESKDVEDGSHNNDAKEDICNGKDIPSDDYKDSIKTVDTQNITSQDPPTYPRQLMWVDRNKPQCYEDLIGNVSCAARLSKWLSNWPRFMKQGFKNTGAEEGAACRAALLSGPPGVGKTTVAHMVSRLMECHKIEFNASDTRSRKLLSDLVSESTKSHSINQYFSSKRPECNDSTGFKNGSVIIMDEVDGMSTGDVGGISELIRIIKDTKVPIICICNDRQSQKIKTLASYCLDIRFRRPTTAQAEKKIASIAEKEGLKIGINVISELIKECSGDIRQILTLLSTYKISKDTVNFGEVKKILDGSKKNVSLSTFDITYKLLSDHGVLNINEKLELYYRDFSLIPLMIQENYPRFGHMQYGRDSYRAKASTKNNSNITELISLSLAAHSISMGDVIDNTMHGMQEWSLLPSHGIYSTVCPSFLVKNFPRGQVAFSSTLSWLGQNSKLSKSNRTISGLTNQIKLRTKSGKEAFVLDYMSTFRRILYMPVLESGMDGIDEVIETMDFYHLIPEDRDAILEIDMGIKLPQISPSIKRALSRRYNSKPHPWLLSSASYKRSSEAVTDSQGDDNSHKTPQNTVEELIEAVMI